MGYYHKFVFTFLLNLQDTQIEANQSTYNNTLAISNATLVAQSVIIEKDFYLYSQATLIVGETSKVLIKGVKIVHFKLKFAGDMEFDSGATLTVVDLLNSTTEVIFVSGCVKLGGKMVIKVNDINQKPHTINILRANCSTGM